MRIRNSFLTAICAALLCLGAAGIAFAAMSDGDFMALCLEGTSQEIEAAIKAGANVNAKNNDGGTALMVAVRNDDSAEQAVSLLLGAGADVNAKNNDGATALMEAAFWGDPGAVSLMLGAGADVNAKANKGYGYTALMLAALGNSANAASLLLKAGADVNAKDNDGATALMLAAHNDMGVSLECFLLLLDNGADPQLTNPKSKEAIDHMLSELSDAKREMVLARLAGKAGGIPATQGH